MSSYVPPFPLNPDEQVIKEGHATYLRSTFTGIGYNPMPGVVWITNQRLMWQSLARRRQLGMTYTPAAFPLRAITHISILPMKVQWSDALVLRIEFENGGKEYFVMSGEPIDWQETLYQAKAQAPALPYDTIPTTRPGVEGAKRRAWLFLAALVVVIPVSCCIGMLLLALIGELFLP